MKFVLSIMCFLFLSGSIKAQRGTEVQLSGNITILDQANAKGKGVYVLMGNPSPKQVNDLSLAFIDLKGELKWSHSLLKKMKRENVSNILLVASESSPSVYVVAYHIRSRKKTEFLVFEINESGKVSDYLFEEELTYSNNIFFACASSQGLHLFVRASVKKGEQYKRASDGVYSAQYFIAHGSKAHEFRNMDERFNPLTTLSGQSGDTLFLYLGVRYSIKVYKYLVTSDEMLAETDQERVVNYSQAVYFVRPQNGFYHSRDHYYIGITPSSNGQAIINYYPYGTAFWGMQHNPSNGHTYAFSTITLVDRKVNGRKRKKKWDYIDQIHVYEFDANLNPVDTTIVWLPEAMEKVPGRVHMIRFLESGYYTHVHCQVNGEGNNVDILIFRKDKSDVGWTTAELNTGNVIRFKVGKKPGSTKPGDRPDYIESFASCFLLDSANTNLPPSVSEYIRQNPRPLYSKGEFTQVLEGNTDKEPVLIEFTSGKSLRILRFAPGVTVSNQQFSMPVNPVFLVEEF